jgi:hypothetical protein
MSSPAEQRAEAEARQRVLAARRRETELAYLGELMDHPTPQLVERALRALGFRNPVEFSVEPPEVVFGERRLAVRDLVRLVRGRTSAGWLFTDVEPLEPVPPRYRRIGEVIELRGELPSVVVSEAVAEGATLGFEIGLDHREWVVERGGTEVGYVGTPPPAVGSAVYAVSPAP